MAGAYEQLSTQLLSLANAKRATMVQSRIKAVEKMDAEAPEAVEMDSTWRFSIPFPGPLGRPIIAIDDVSFDYTPAKPDGTKKKESEYLLQKVNFGVDLDSRIAILGANGQGKRLFVRRKPVYPVSNYSGCHPPKARQHC